jgi:hypothetical protein
VQIAITPRTAAVPANVVATGTGSVAPTASGDNATAYLRVAFITGPKIEAEVDIESINQPVLAALFTSLLTKVAARAAAA